MEIVMNKEQRYERMPSSKMLLYVGIGSIVMLFAGLTSAYLVRQAEGNWLKFELPQLFWVSSGLILLSSVTMNWAVVSAKRNNSSSVTKAIFLTTLLGFGFMISQYLSWTSLYSQGIIFAGNPSGSFLYVITGFHVAHLIGGLITLLVVLYKSSKKIYNSGNMTGIQNCAIYWHFLDALWIYLFIFLLYVR
jgi:cytochrome c oxidase subunit 3